jgi:hypothetical protein
MRDFDAQTYGEKMEQLWANTTAPSVVGKSLPAKSLPEVVGQIVTESMITPFEDQWEVLPEGRSKVIHGQGVVCQVVMQISAASPFTGVLAPGNASGLLRLGSATTLDFEIFPGLGIKFPRSGVRSASWVALRTSGPGGSNDFFNSTFSNHVAPPPQLVALHKFQQASGCIE